MEVDKSSDTNPVFEMHRQLTDAQKELITFEMLRKAWKAWAISQLGFEDEKRGHVSHRLPSSSEPTE